MRVAASWSRILVLFTCGVVGMFQIAQVPPALAVLQSDLRMSEMTAGWSISIVTAIGIPLGVLAGSFITAIGSRRALVAGVLITGAAGIAGAFASSTGVFLAARFVSGVGYTIITVAAPTLLALTTTARRQALALAMWGCFVPTSVAIMNFAGPPILERVSWREFFAGNSAILLILAGLVMALVRVETTTDPGPRGWQTLGSTVQNVLRQLARARRAVYLAAFFGLFTVVYLAFISYVPIFSTESVGLAAGIAGSIIAFTSLVAILGTASSGVILQRTHRTQRAALITIIAFTIMSGAASLLYATADSQGQFLWLCLLFYLPSGFVPAAVFAMIPRIAESPGEIAISAGLIASSGNLGSFVGPPLMAGSVHLWGWDGSVFLYAGCALLAAPLLFLATTGKAISRPARAAS